MKSRSNGVIRGDVGDHIHATIYNADDKLSLHSRRRTIFVTTIVAGALKRVYPNLI